MGSLVNIHGISWPSIPFPLFLLVYTLILACGQKYVLNQAKHVSPPPPAPVTERKGGYVTPILSVRLESEI